LTNPKSGLTLEIMVFPLDPDLRLVQHLPPGCLSGRRFF